MRPRGRPSGVFRLRPVRYAFRQSGRKFVCSLQHARAVLPAGDPLAAASPGNGLRGPTAGGADLSPLRTTPERSRQERRRGLCGRVEGVWIEIFYDTDIATRVAR